MTVTEERLQKILKMMRIGATGEERRRLFRSLDEIMRWITKIEEVDVADVPPFKTMSTECDRFWSYQTATPLDVGQALMNAPQHDGAYFRVPSTAAQPPRDL